MGRPAHYRLLAAAFVFSWFLFPQSLPNSWAAVLEIPLDPDFDQIGAQIETVQIYQYGSNEWTTFGLYDTGASVATISYLDQYYFDYLGSHPPVPVITPSEAYADGIDGPITGRVSQPGTVSADGMHAFSFNNDWDITITPSPYMATVPNVRLFVGTESGSADLPTITGTPIHSLGKAAKINLQADAFAFEGLIFTMPDIFFVNPGSTEAHLTPTTKTPTPVRIPLQLIGPNNYGQPGSDVTSAQNPVQNQVALRKGLNPDGSYASNVTNKTFLFDTGAQFSIINRDIALDLGVNLSAPLITIPVQGAAGNPINASCYVIDALELPRDDNADGVIDGTLKLTNAPIFVIDGVDLSDFGLDGILGMNLWNSVGEMLYDPTASNPSLSLTVSDINIDQMTLDEMEELSVLLAQLPADFFGDMSVFFRNLATLHIPQLPPSQSVPEPSTWIILTMGLAGLISHGLREKFRRRFQ